jgi:hypothetical protein
MEKVMKQVGICTYCGEECLTTRDHVPPLSIFPPESRSNVNFVTVPACAKCNDGVHDEDFKVFISLCTGMKTDAQNNLLKSVQRTVAKNSKLKQEIIRGSTRIYLPTKGWPVYQEAYSLGWDTQPFRRVMARIIRGLYYNHYKTRLPNSTKIDIHFPEDFPENIIPHFFEFFEKFVSNCSGGKIGSKNEFIYLFGNSKESNLCTFWTFVFYERLLVFGFTKPDDLNP